MIIMSNMIETLLLRNLQEVFGEGDPERRRSAIDSYTPKIAWSTCLSASTTGTTHSTESAVSCAPATPAMFTPHITRR